MQMMLPIFPVSTKMISASLGVITKDGIITYLHCGVPIYSHAADNYKSFRYITSKFILQGLCRLIDISECFHVSYDSVKRYVKKLEQTGERGFFGDDNRTGGSPYKLMPAVIERIQKKMDQGKSNSEIARSEGVSEGAVRYAIKKGTLKKKPISPTGSNRTDRSIADAHAPLGIATTRLTERVLAAVGYLDEVTPQFTHANNVCNAGVLFIIPALISQGLLKASDVYVRLRKGYYGLVSILLVLSIMYLCRIKCPEQLKSSKVGELGIVLGLDRIPEAKCLRSKIEQIVSQNKAEQLNQILSQQWIDKEEPIFFYIDGHIRVYHGYLAHVPKRFVSREKLCLAGTTEFWVNDELGMPYMVVTSELNEKLKEIILEKILPSLLRDTRSQTQEEVLKRDPDHARFTIVFDREGYDIPFFKTLWDEHRIAVLTYKKAVKDTWSAADFHECKAIVIGKDVPMRLCEKPWLQDGIRAREIRKLSEDGHQTSIVTTLRKGSQELLAGKMFSRWSQENFFRYMVQDYGLDRMSEYGTEKVDQEKQIVNPSYKIVTYQIKKLREKAARLKVKLFTKVEDALDCNIDGLKEQLQQQSTIQESLNEYEEKIDRLCKERKLLPYHIKLKDMPEEVRYNKLKTESKLFLNAIRMIAYRAETAVANILTPYYSKSNNEIRSLVKEIIAADADIIPDYDQKTLLVRLHTLSSPRANAAVKELCVILNETESVFPGTDLRLLYSIV